MCSSGSKTKTTTSSTQALPQYADAYSKLLGQAQNVASTPWNPNTGQSVAGFSSPQTQAFDLTQQNLGAWQPSLSAATNLVAQGTTPITTNSIINNPLYQQQVDAINNASNLAQGQTTSAVNANAAKIGALTGDRSQLAVGQALAPITAAQQSALANAASNTFQQTLGAQEFNNQAALQGANLYGNLAGQAQNYGLTDISSLLGIGNQQQQQQQNVLNANTANAQAQAQYPFATTQWLASLETGLGGAAGTQSTQTQPGPNIWSQLLGAGLAGASLYSGKAAGGRVGYASGGDVTGTGLPYGDAPSYVPTTQMPHGGMNHQGPMPSIDDQTGGGMSGLVDNFKQAHSAFQGIGNLGAKMSDWATGTTRGVSVPSVSGNGYYIPEFATSTTPTSSSWFSDGGTVRRGYEKGGDVTDLVDDGSGTYAPAGMMNLGSNMGSYLTADASPWTTTVARAPQHAVARSQPAAASLPTPSGVGAVSQASPSGAVSTAPMAVPYDLPTTPWLFGTRLSDPARQGLLAAGLGMMASQSPWIGTAIGEGGLQGVDTYNKTRQQAVENTQNKQRVDIQAQELAQRAKQAAESLKLGYAQLASEAPLRAAQVANYQLTNEQTRAGMNALSGSDVLKPYIGTPFESVARAAAAKGDVGALADINKEMAQYGLLPMGAGIPAATTTDGKPVPLDDYLKGIPDPLVRGQVGAALRGEATLQNLTSRSPGTAAQVNRYVYNFEPTFSPTDAANRVAITKSLADHKAGNLGAYSDSIGKMADHLNLVAKAAENLQTTPVLVWNTAKQTFETQSGDPRATNFASAANVYMHELAKVLKGGNGTPTDADMEGLARVFSQNMSPDQLRGVLQNWDHASRAAIESTDATSERAMGQIYDPSKHSVVTPYARKKLDALDSNRWLHPEAGPPPEAIQLLKANPDAVHRASFDKHFGAGASAQILGAQ